MGALGVERYETLTDELLHIAGTFRHMICDELNQTMLGQIEPPTEAEVISLRRAPRPRPEIVKLTNRPTPMYEALGTTDSTIALASCSDNGVAEEHWPVMHTCTDMEKGVAGGIVNCIILFDIHQEEGGSSPFKVTFHSSGITSPKLVPFKVTTSPGRTPKGDAAANAGGAYEIVQPKEKLQTTGEPQKAIVKVTGTFNPVPGGRVTCSRVLSLQAMRGAMRCPTKTTIFAAMADDPKPLPRIVISEPPLATRPVWGLMLVMTGDGTIWTS